MIALPVAGAATAIAKRDTVGVLELAEAFVASDALTEVLKEAVGERRPDGGEHSFPSRHTSRAFTGAAFLHRRYGWQWGGTAYFAAALVGASRVTSRSHFAHDVVAGAAIGIGANLLFTDDRGQARVTVVPRALERGAGLHLSWSF